MSSVLTVITIPTKETEPEIRQKEQLSLRLRKKAKKDNHYVKEEDEVEEKYVPLEKIVEDGLSYLGIDDAGQSLSANGRFKQIVFPVDLEDSDIVLQHFKSFGIGLRLESSIGIIPFSLFHYNEEFGDIDQDLLLENGNGTTEKDVSKSIKTFKDRQSRFLKSVTARLTVAQIVDGIRTSSSVTFDFICYLVFASWIAAMGLLDNSVISLVASMLVSPMMGPVLAFTFGTIIKDRSLRNMGARNILVCLMVTISFGFFYGMISLNFTEQWNNWAWPTDMMRERGLVRVFWVGTLVAFPSGCAVAISILSGNDASLVGVAISVSLLPPAVNAGLLWSYSFLKLLYSIGQSPVLTHSRFNKSEALLMKQAFIHNTMYEPVYDDNVSIETLILGVVSLGLSLINIANIIIGSLLLLKIKEIVPLKTLSPESGRFFQEDIKIARKYNEQRDQRKSNMGEDLLKEWADVAGLDSKEFLKPEAKAVQLQTLADIVKDVEQDEVFQTVSKIRPTSDNLARRLSQAVLTSIPQTLLDRKLNRSCSVRSYTSMRSERSLQNHQNPSIVISELDPSSLGRRPSTQMPYSGNRRRISTVAINNYYDKDENMSTGRLGSGYSNGAFTFNEADINQHNQQMTYDRNRRFSSALLRFTLQNSDHSPYSLWPSTRHNIVTSFDRRTAPPDTPPPNWPSTPGPGRPSTPHVTKFEHN